MLIPIGDFWLNGWDIAPSPPVYSQPPAHRDVTVMLPAGSATSGALVSGRTVSGSIAGGVSITAYLGASGSVEGEILEREFVLA